MEYVVRFALGGIVVSAFAIVADVVRPKSFAGLFGAAPSLALATLSLAIWQKGTGYGVIEARSMILGSLALAVYSLVVCQMLERLRWSALAATSAAIVVWFAIALGAVPFMVG